MGLAVARELVHRTLLRLVADRLVLGSAGDVSLRLDEHTMVVSAGGVPYDRLSPADHPLVDLRTGEWSHGHAPSGELALHVAIMRDVPDVTAVVHTHSPYATGFAVARQPLEFVCNENIGTASQRILVTDPYAPPGSVELADAAVRTFARQPGSRACLLANHGPVAVGASLDAALLVAMEVEWIAQITFVARSVGPVHVITSEHQDAIARSCGVIVGREHGVHDRRS